jgi:hypothetical protein
LQYHDIKLNFTINTPGILSRDHGYTTDGNNVPFDWGLYDTNNLKLFAEYAYLDTEEEGEKVLVKEFTQTLYAVALWIMIVWLKPDQC